MELWKVWLETDEEDKDAQRSGEFVGLSRGVKQQEHRRNAVIIPS